jgi:hypothetical protein
MLNWKPLQTSTNVNLTYSAADAPVYVADTSEDLTSTISSGMRLRVSQSTGGTKYFIVVATDASTITLYGGTDYVLENEAIDEPVFSDAKAPFGFPLNPTKWTVEFTDANNRSQSSPVSGTWYNLGSTSITIPIGVWNVVTSYNIAVTMTSGANSINATLSTTNNSETDTDMTTILVGNGPVDLEATVYREKVYSIASETTYYLNAKGTGANLTGIYFVGSLGKTILRAICAYL